MSVRNATTNLDVLREWSGLTIVDRSFYLDTASREIDRLVGSIPVAEEAYLELLLAAHLATMKDPIVQRTNAAGLTTEYASVSGFGSHKTPYGAQYNDTLQHLLNGGVSNGVPSFVRMT